MALTRSLTVRVPWHPGRAASTSAIALGVSRQEPDDFAVFGEAPAVLLRVDERPISQHVELRPGSGCGSRLDPELR